ncbi:MAG: hypothetical protein Q7S73_00785 [bacterium]|nr:hypothetical protein [bacterium]
MSKFMGKMAVLGALLGVILPMASLADMGDVNQILDTDPMVMDLVNQELVDLADLGMENPGILQTNPFYFMKNFRWSTQRTFTFNYLKKAELELDIMTQKAAELKRLIEISPNNSEGINSALDAYRGSADNLKSYLKGLKDGNGAGSLEEKLIDQGIKQIRILNELKNKNDFRADEKLENIQIALSEAVILLAEKVDSPLRLYFKIENILNKQKGGLFRNVVLVEALNYLEEKSSSNAGIFAALKENLLIDQLAKIDAENLAPVLPGVFSLLPGDLAGRIKVLDELKERVNDMDLKSELNVIRQNLLDLGIKQREIGKLEAMKLISESGRLSGILENKLSSFKKSNLLNTLFSRAKFNLKQAQESFDGNQYGAAFGQASLSFSASQNALSQLARFENFNNENLLSRDLKNLKGMYDNLIISTNASGLNSNNSSKLFELLVKSEKALAKVSDLQNKNGNLDSIAPALRDAKYLIFKSNQVTNSLLAMLEKSAKEKRAGQSFIERVLPLNQAKEKEIKKEVIDEMEKGN